MVPCFMVRKWPLVSKKELRPKSIVLVPISTSMIVGREKNHKISWKFLKISSSPTLPETNSSHLKMDGWNTIISFWGPAYFQGQTCR